MKDDIFGLCWNLRLVIRVMIISWRILVSFKGFFEDYIFAWWNYILSFHNSSFCLKIHLNVNGKATVWHTPCFVFVFVLLPLLKGLFLTRLQLLTHKTTLFSFLFCSVLFCSVLWGFFWGEGVSGCVFFAVSQEKANSTYLQFWVTRKVGLVLPDFLYTLVTKWKGEEAGSSRWGGTEEGREGCLAT